jgi:hypothetical protein
VSGERSHDREAHIDHNTVKRKPAERRSPCGERRVKPHGPLGLNSLNRRGRTRMYSGVVVDCSHRIFRSRNRLASRRDIHEREYVKYAFGGSQFHRSAGPRAV